MILLCQIHNINNNAISAIQFNSDTVLPKLAVAQSDCIVFVYKWTWTSFDSPSDSRSNSNTPSIHAEGQQRSDVWSGKKTICNKFSEASSVTCLVWPARRPGEVIYGLEDGSVKMGILRSNTAQTLHKCDHPVIAIASKLDGSGVATSHLDGSIFVINFLFGNRDSSGQVSLLSRHPCPAYAIAWGRSICVAGNDEVVVFYDEKGKIEQRIDYSATTEERKSEVPYCKEFSCATCSSSGDALIFGNFDWFAGYVWDKNQNLWKEDFNTVVEHMHNVSCIAWNADSSQVAVGSSVGLLDLYSSFLYKCSYKDTFDIVCITPSYVTLSPVDDEKTSDKTCAIRSKKGGDILKLQFFPDFQQQTDRYVVAQTKDTLLVCDTENPLSFSELDWANNKGERKFIFNYSNAFVVCEEGEFIVIEVGFKTSTSSCLRMTSRMYSTYLILTCSFLFFSVRKK